MPARLASLGHKIITLSSFRRKNPLEPRSQPSSETVGDSSSSEPVDAEPFRGLQLPDDFVAQRIDFGDGSAATAKMRRDRHLVSEEQSPGCNPDIRPQRKNSWRRRLAGARSVKAALEAASKVTGDSMPSLDTWSAPASMASTPTPAPNYDSSNRIRALLLVMQWQHQRRAQQRQRQQQQQPLACTAAAATAARPASAKASAAKIAEDARLKASTNPAVVTVTHRARPFEAAVTAAEAAVEELRTAAALIQPTLYETGSSISSPPAPPPLELNAGSQHSPPSPADAPCCSNGSGVTAWGEVPLPVFAARTPYVRSAAPSPPQDQWDQRQPGSAHRSEHAIDSTPRTAASAFSIPFPGSRPEDLKPEGLRTQTRRKTVSSPRQQATPMSFGNPAAPDGPWPGPWSRDVAKLDLFGLFTPRPQPQSRGGASAPSQQGLESGAVRRGVGVKGTPNPFRGRQGGARTLSFGRSAPSSRAPGSGRQAVGAGQDKRLGGAEALTVVERAPVSSRVPSDLGAEEPQPLFKGIAKLAEQLAGLGGGGETDGLELCGKRGRAPRGSGGAPSPSCT